MKSAEIYGIMYLEPANRATPPNARKANHHTRGLHDDLKLAGPNIYARSAGKSTDASGAQPSHPKVSVFAVWIGMNVDVARSIRWALRQSSKQKSRP